MYLGRDKLKKRWDGRVRCTDDTGFAQRAVKPPRGAGSGGWGEEMGVEGYGIQNSVYCTCTIQQVRRDLAAGTYRTCVCPFTPAGARRRRQENSRRELGRRVATWGYWRDAVALAGAASTAHVAGGGLRGAFLRDSRAKSAALSSPAANAKGH